MKAAQPTMTPEEERHWAYGMLRGESAIHRWQWPQWDGKTAKWTCVCSFHVRRPAVLTGRSESW